MQNEHLRVVSEPLYTQRSRRSSYEMLKLIEEGGTIGFWSLDLATTVFESSTGCMRILGVKTERAPYCVLREMMHPDDLTDNEDVIALMRNGLAVDRQFRILRSDRTIRKVRVRAEISLDQDNRPARADGIICDITEMDAIRVASAYSQENYRNLVQATACVVWRVSPEGYLASSEGWASLTGQSVDEQRGDGWMKALHLGDRNRVAEGWLDRFTKRTPIEIEFRVVCRDGVSRWHHCRLIPQFNRDGSIRDWFGGLTKIRERIDPPVLTVQPGKDDLTGPMVRAARGALNWTIADLAQASRLSISTIKRLEEIGSVCLRKETGSVIRRALEEKGIFFTIGESGEIYIRIQEEYNYRQVLK